MNYFPPKFMVSVFMLLAAFSAKAQEGFVCTPSTVSPISYTNDTNKCPEAAKFSNQEKRCDKFLISKDTARQEQDKYTWNLQNDDISKKTMILDRYTGRYIMEILYVSHRTVGFSIVGVCEAAQMPKPRL